MFVIWSSTARAYVAQDGSACSFTRSIDRARKWNSHAAALANCCGDESVRGIAR